MNLAIQTHSKAMVALAVVIAMVVSILGAYSFTADAAESTDGYELAMCGTIDLPGANDDFTCEGPFYVDATGTVLVDDDGDVVRPEITGSPDRHFAQAPCTLGHTYVMDSNGHYAPTQWGCVGGDGPLAPRAQCTYTEDLAGCDDFGGVGEHYDVKRNWAAVFADNPARGGAGIYAGGINEGQPIIVDGEIVGYGTGGLADLPPADEISFEPEPAEDECVDGIVGPTGECLSLALWGDQ